MIKGMTGFGSEQFLVQGIRALVEIKSVNHRYFDINYYLPIGFASIENKIKKILDAEMERGRITVSLKFLEKPAPAISMNQKIIEEYLQFEKKIKSQLKIKGELTISELLLLPGIFDIKENFLEADDVWVSLEKSLRRGLKKLTVMRRAEGRALAKDLNDKSRRIKKHLAIIDKRLKDILLEKKNISSPEEFSSFQKSSDIHEEIIRMKHYLDELGVLLRSTEAVGKKIDFIAQEMQRETNTIGSKVQDRVVSNSVIGIKSKIEKIREQAQNIE
jgi:uncharacterized protein (TIGR00255 family)